MQKSLSIIVGLTCIIFNGLLLFLLAKKQVCSLLRRRRLPPGPWGVPVLGSLPFLSPDLHRSFAAMAGTYGPVFSLRLGSRLCVILSSASAAEQALRDHDAVLADRDPPTVARISTYGFSDILCAPCGPTWRAVRKAGVRELLCPAAVSAAAPLMRWEVKRAVGELRGRAERREAVDMREVLFNLPLKIMQVLLWGEERDGDDSRRDEEFQEVVDGMMELMAKPNLSDFFPLLAPLDLQGLDGDMKRWTERYEVLFESFRRKTEGRKRQDGGFRIDAKGIGNGNPGQSFLEVLLAMVGDDKAADPPLTVENVKGLLLDMIIGGTDTTSTTSEWALAELVRHPAAMAKARQELYAVVGDHATIDESHLSRLPYLAAVVKEALRLHHIIPLLFPRRAREDCVIDGYTIPKDAKVMVNVWAIQRDPGGWPNEPLAFKPERFLTASSEAKTGDCGAVGRRGFEYLPFGSGRRSCVGVGMGERMVMLVLASLVHAFEWELPVGVKEVSVEDEFGLVLKMKKPLVLVPRWRLGDMKISQ